MMLIADSGSTKCDWVLVRSGQPEEKFYTAGFNPFFHKEGFIVGELRQQSKLISVANEIRQVFFYGASCSSEERKGIIRDALRKVFIHADISVEHDLAAAAYAVYEGEPCIAAIAGTGSNSCYFDGKKIHEEVPALGYILGDEGSGSYFGKILLKKFLYHQLPGKISKTLESEYGLTKEKIFENVYSKPHANVYIASFFKVAAAYKDDEFVRQMISGGMKDFMENHICCFKDFRKVKTHFVGSVGFLFEDVLRTVASSMDITIGKVIKQPIGGLVGYHLKYVS